MPEVRAAADPGRWEILRSSGRWDCPALRRDWRGMVESTGNPNAMYQSPEWFDHLREMNDERDLALATIRGTDGHLDGLVPLRVGRHALDFHIAGNTLSTIPLQKVFFLGSRPMAPENPEVLDRLLEAADRAFPESHGLGFPAVDAGDPFWQYLRESRFVNDRFIPYVVDGFREYHLLPLPSTFDEYLSRYDSKKRYNLRRQLRLFREHGRGRLELRRIERPEDVDDYLQSQAAFDRKGPGPAPSVHQPDPTSHPVRNLRSVAGRGLLRSYVLYCGDEVAGLIRGNHYLGNYVVSRIECRQDLAAFSPGVMLLHLAIEDLIVHGPTRLINFGFGEPSRKHHQANVVHQYGSVLLLRRTLANRLRWLGHRSFRSAVAVAKHRLARGR